MAKRKRVQVSANHPVKRLKVGDGIGSDNAIEQPALTNHYKQVQTLRLHIYSRLPSKSRNCRKRLRSLENSDPSIATLLRTTLVGIRHEGCEKLSIQRQSELHGFVQRQRARRASPPATSCSSFDEILEFVIWALFQKCSVSTRAPSNVLCHGLSRTITADTTEAICKDYVAPGITLSHPSATLQSLKQGLWSRLLNALGHHGERIICDLLFELGVFQELQSGRNNYFQLSGTPLYELSPFRREIQTTSEVTSVEPCRQNTETVRTPAQIKFVRTRIFYAKPSINNAGQAKMGLKHIHAFNRYGGVNDHHQDIKIMCYIFPKQFHLHNVFTSTVNKQETTHPFKDYTVREDEILQLVNNGRLKVPRRLRGRCLTLVRRIRHNHQLCSYSQLLRHYCSLLSLRRKDDQHSLDGVSFLLYATSVHHVSSFCRAVIRKLIPKSAFGTGEGANRNWSIVNSHVDHFIRMHRYETFSLHQVVSTMRMKCISWLAFNDAALDKAMSLTEKCKREELLQEFVYYIFDSILIPLLRSNFYITESGVHRNQLFYFRHDVWKRLSEPALASIRLGALRPLSSREASLACKTQALGYNQFRLLPKEKGARAITNLKRRVMKRVNGQTILSTSTNAQLGPVFGVMNFERHERPNKFASAMFSVSEIQHKLRDFLKIHTGSAHKPFYFVKVDIQSAFDTIPQSKLLARIDQLIEGNSYRFVKYALTKWSSDDSSASSGHLRKRFTGSARCLDDVPPLSLQDAERTTRGKKNIVLTSTNNQRALTKQALKQLLRKHISTNIIKIGRKHFQQLEGIPQGSVLSSLLCNYFYADFEQNYLNFLKKTDSLLLRLIDDFLLITVDCSQAFHFAEAMMKGSQSHGIHINAEKSLANFDITIGEHRVPKTSRSSSFPYCGLLINTTNLDVGKDRARKDHDVRASLTVDIHGRTGLIFRRRLLASMRIQLQALLLDPVINSRKRILQTLIECFGESAMKMHQYRRSMPPECRPRQNFVMEAIEQSIVLAMGLVHKHVPSAHCIVTKNQMRWIAAVSYTRVLAVKQSQYQEVCQVLLHWQRSYRHSMGSATNSLEELVNSGLANLSSYNY